MPIERIDSEKCRGCGTCVDTCASDVIRMDEKSKKAVITYPEDCRLCALCEVFCPEDAIYVSPMRRAPVLTSW